MSAVQIYFAFHCVLLLLLAGLGLWHWRKRHPLLYFANDAILALLFAIIAGGAAITWGPRLLGG